MLYIHRENVGVFCVNIKSMLMTLRNQTENEPLKTEPTEVQKKFSYVSLFLRLVVIIVILGLVGWVLGFIFTQPYWYETGHSVIYTYGQLAMKIGPIVAIIGLILFVLFHILIKK
jgi:hypothetical protein